MITQIDVNGKTMFVHTAWSDDPEGGGMVTTEPEDADYIGTCTDSSSEEVTDPGRYTWRYADINANLDDSDDEFEEDEEDDDGALDDGMEDVESSLQEVAGRIDTQGMDMVNTTNVTDSAIGNANELEGTNKGKTGWTVPDGFTLSEQSEDVDGNPDTDPVLTSVITRTATGNDSVIRFDAGTLVQALADTEEGNAYTMSLQSKMTSLFDVPVSLADPDGSNVMLDFGSISNALIDAPEDPEEEDAGERDAADGNPTIEDIIEDEELAEEEPTGETTGEDAWTWFESTAESTGAAVSSQVLRFDLSAMPVGATLAIADLKIEPGAMATPWKKSIKEVAETAASAQSTADDAKTLAAKTNQHFWTDGKGAHITTTAQGEAISGGNTLITGEGMEVRDGDTALASFKGDGINIGTQDVTRLEIGASALAMYVLGLKLFDMSVAGLTIGLYPTGYSRLNASSLEVGSQLASQIFRTMQIYSGDKLAHSTGITVNAGESVNVNCRLPYAVKSVDDIEGSTGITEVHALTGLVSSHGWSANVSSDGYSVKLSGTVPATTDDGTAANDLVLRLTGITPAASSVSETYGGGYAEFRDSIKAGGWIEASTMQAEKIALSGDDITDLFSGGISIGYEDKGLNLSAGGNTGDSTISLSKDGYSARCICGWNLSGTGSSNCTIARLYVNQTEQKIHYYAKNTGSSKATPTLRIYILYTKNN